MIHPVKRQTTTPSLIAAILIGMAALVAAPHSVTAFQGDGQLFNDMNMAGRSAYAKLHSKPFPVGLPIFLITDKVTLINGRKFGAVPYTPPLYDQLKSIAHLSLGLVSAGLYALEMPNDPFWRSAFGDLRAKALAAKGRLDSSVLNAEQKQRQIQLIDLSVDYIDRALAQAAVNAGELKAYSLATAPILLANTTDAANAQIEALDQAVKSLAKQLSPDEWGRAMAVITGPKTPREGNLQAQYFLFSFGEKATGQRVQYMENIFDEDQALSVLQTILTDRKIGSIFFNDPTRMERDLLSDAATVELMRRFGRLGPARP